MIKLSEHPRRNQQYHKFIQQCGSQTNAPRLENSVYLGRWLMWRARCHHHFFGDLTLLDTAKQLACFALNIPIDTYLEAKKQVLSEAEAQKIFAVFEQRIAKRLPVEYITHEAKYLNHTFYVNEHVLVPRSLMNTRFKDFLDAIPWQTYRVLDLCTGSGCIGISLALLNPNIKVDLADISAEALKVANINIQKHQLENRVQCIQGDLFENINAQYDLIITNPPYVTEFEYKQSPQEFKQEPKLALTADNAGLSIVDKILTQAKPYLSPNGILIAEVGFTAAKRI